MRRTKQLDVQTVKMALLKFAHEHDVDSATLVQAMAEITGMVAALADRDVGLQSFDARIAEFSEHARETYRRGPGIIIPRGH